MMVVEKVVEEMPSKLTDEQEEGMFTLDK